MERRLEQKLERHRREGVTYPNAGAALTLGLTAEQQRFALKMARHQAAQLIVDAEARAPETKPAEEAPAQADKRGGKRDDKG